MVFLSLFVALTMALGWAAVAQAQEGPAENEYGNPAGSGGRAIQAADIGAGNGGGGNGGGGNGGGGNGGGGGDGDGRVAAVTGRLPSTGGALLPFAALGILALSSAGLLALRREGQSR